MLNHALRQPHRLARLQALCQHGAVPDMPALCPRAKARFSIHHALRAEEEDETGFGLRPPGAPRKPRRPEVEREQVVELVTPEPPKPIRHPKPPQPRMAGVKSTGGFGLKGYKLAEDKSMLSFDRAPPPHASSEHSPSEPKSDEGEIIPSAVDRTSASSKDASHPPTFKLFMGNLSYKAQNEDLEDMFTMLGSEQPINVSIVKNRDGRHEGCAIARFADADAATKVLEAVNGRSISICGRPVFFEYSKQSTQPYKERPDPNPTDCLFLFKLPKGLTAADLLDSLKVYGCTPVDVRVTTLGNYAHVHYASVEDASKVMTRMREWPLNIRGYRVEVKYSDRGVLKQMHMLQPSRLLYIGNLDATTTAADIGQLVEPYGSGIVEVRLTYLPKGAWARVEYESVAQATVVHDAMRAASPIALQTATIHIDYLGPHHTRAPTQVTPSKVLYVGTLAGHTTAADIGNALENAGIPVVEVRLRGVQRRELYAYVEVEDIEAAQRAIEMHRKRPIKVLECPIILEYSTAFTSGDEASTPVESEESTVAPPSPSSSSSTTRLASSEHVPRETLEQARDEPSPESSDKRRALLDKQFFERPDRGQNSWGTLNTVTPSRNVRGTAYEARHAGKSTTSGEQDPGYEEPRRTERRERSAGQRSRGRVYDW